MDKEDKILGWIYKNWNKFDPFVPTFLIKLGRDMFIWNAGRNDYSKMKEIGDFAIPPAKLRFRVNGTPSLEIFVKGGKNNKNDLENALSKVEKNFDSFEKILDFGCGCGRLLKWLDPKKNQKFYGTDIDNELISWCKKFLTAVEFSTNARMPPLKFVSNTFDFVYSLSVFTHLDEKSQFEWLKELQRITKKNGLILVTLHSIDIAKNSNKKIKIIEGNFEKGFVYAKGGLFEGIFPDWYQNSYHSKDYVMNIFSQFFQVLDYFPRGLGNFQDMVLLQNQKKDNF